MTQKLILASLLHEELPFNGDMCSKLKSNGGSGKQNHSCAGVPGVPQLPLSSPVCIESSKGRIFWLERSLLFRKMGIHRISSPPECLWVGTFRTCKIIKPEKTLWVFSQNSIHSKHNEATCCLCCWHALRPESYDHMEIPDAFLLNACFPQTHLVNALNFIPFSGIKDSADLEDSQVSWKLFSVNFLWFSAKNGALVSLAYDIAFCMPHVLQNASTRWHFKFSALSWSN